MNVISGRISCIPALLGALVLAGCGAAPRGTVTGNWPETIENAYGGRAAFDSIRFLRFDFVVRDAGGAEQGRTRHLWDKQTGDYRFESPAESFAKSGFLNRETDRWEAVGLDLPAGDLVALVNLNTGAGGVYVNGERQPDADLAAYAIQRIHNDIFWLALPFKLREARLADRGLGATPEGQAARVVEATFAPGQGVTPRDVYTLYLDPHSGRILRDEIALQNTDRVVKADWRGSKRVGLCDLATHRHLEGGRLLVFDPLEALWVLPDKVFTNARAEMP